MLDMRHSLVNILYMIKGLAETHRSRFKEGYFDNAAGASAYTQEVIGKIYTQAERALSITRRIGWIMKSAKSSEGPLESVSVKDVWGGLTDFLTRQRLAQGIEIINHIPAEFPKILCHRHDLAEILHGLMTNAIQAMNGEGKLVIRAHLGFRVDESPIAHITLADTGPGMAEETLNHLFEPFVTTKSAEEGNGLGLCLVKGLVRKNGGSISVSSFKGCGTTFTLTFPVAKTQDKVVA